MTTSTAKQNNATLAKNKSSGQRINDSMVFWLQALAAIFAILNIGCMTGRDLTPVSKSLVALKPAAATLSSKLDPGKYGSNGDNSDAVQGNHTVMRASYQESQEGLVGGPVTIATPTGTVNGSEISALAMTLSDFESLALNSNPTIQNKLLMRLPFL